MPLAFRTVLLCTAMGSSLLAQAAPDADRSPSGHGVPTTPNDALQRVMQAERDRQAAFVRNDIAALDRGTADDYTTIGGGGTISTKAQMMDHLRAGTTKVVSNSLDSLRARIYGQTAVLTGVLREISETGNQRKDERFFFTRVFVHSRGRWLAVAYQQTAIGGPSS